jgi:hypothetical protein
MADDAKQPEPWEVETAPAEVDAETGVYMSGNYPLNDRLRAEALVGAKRTTDPDGLISDAMIADVADQMKAAADARPVDGNTATAQPAS